MKSKGLSQVLFVLSAIAVVLAALDSFDVGVWLAASTWLLVALVFGIWAVYTEE